MPAPLTATPRVKPGNVSLRPSRPSRTRPVPSLRGPGGPGTSAARCGPRSPRQHPARFSLPMPACLHPGCTLLSRPSPRQPPPQRHRTQPQAPPPQLASGTVSLPPSRPSRTLPVPSLRGPGGPGTPAARCSTRGPHQLPACFSLPMPPCLHPGCTLLSRPSPRPPPPQHQRTQPQAPLPRLVSGTVSLRPSRPSRTLPVPSPGPRAATSERTPPNGTTWKKSATPVSGVALAP